MTDFKYFQGESESSLHKKMLNGAVPVKREQQLIRLKNAIIRRIK